MSLNFTLNFMQQHIVAKTMDKVLSDGQRMVLCKPDEAGTIKSGDKSVGIVNHGDMQTRENNAIRQELLDACKSQFGVKKFSDLPECVRKAFKVSAVKDDLKLQTDDTGKEIVTSGRPLTARRIQRVIAAVEQEIPMQLFSKQLDVASPKLGIELNDKQRQMLMTSYARALASDGVPYLIPRHVEQTKNLMAFLKDGDFSNCNLQAQDESEIKTTVAIIRQIPIDKRADALALALTVGTDAMAHTFASRSVLEEVLTRKPKGGVIDAPLLKKWADKKVATFYKRYPDCPKIYSKEEPSYLLDKASIMRFLMKVEDYKRTDLAIHNQDKSSDMDFAAWKPKTDKNDNGEVCINDRLLLSDTLSLIRNLSIDYYEDVLLKNWSSSGGVLTKDCIPPGMQPQNLAYLKDVKKSVQDDLPRTHITATMTKSDGKTIEIDTGKCPKADDAEKKTTEIYNAVMSFLGINELTSQAKTIVGMFSQWGMSIRYQTGMEHLARYIEIMRDNDDVVVHVTNSKNEDEKGEVHFDFTIRIDKDGNNKIVALDVRPQNVQNKAS